MKINSRKSKKIKTISFFVAAILMIGTLAGCGTGKNDSGDTFDTSREITVVSREEGSGTRGAFIELMGIEKKDASGNKVDYTTEEAVISNSTSVVMTTVAGNEYSIGYISLGSLNDTVKALKIEGVEATAENIKNGAYVVSRPFNIATKGELDAASADFIKFILSAQGQKVVADNKYIAVDDAAPQYAASGITGKIVVAGSSSVTPVMEKLREAYIKLNPDVTIEVQQSDSTTGMTSAIDGICQIGMASRALKDSELQAGLTPAVIAMDGIAVIANKANPTEGLTKEMVRQIFTGEVLTWDEVK
ncbi:MAG: substrate-binding domain-containing protein [Christensenellales bacterium]